MKHPFRIACMAASLPLALTLFTTAQTPTPKTKPAAHAPQPQDRGEHLFNANCVRCHQAPETMNPRITGTIVRHMRVRANLSAADERDILRHEDDAPCDGVTMQPSSTFLLLSLVSFMALAMCACKVDQPSAIESRTITFVKHHLTAGNKSENNPQADNAENRLAGKEAFGHYCVACHGLDGQNTGVPFAAKMSPPLPLLTSPDVQRYTDGQLKWIIDNGLQPSGMPASKGTLSDEEIWSIVVYLRHLPPAGSLGEPEMYRH